MPRSDAAPDGPARARRPRIDLPAWLALAWAGWFAALYAKMLLEARFPWVLAAVGRWLGRG